MPNEETEFRTFLDGLDETKVDEETPIEELYDFSEKKPVEQTDETKVDEETKEVPFHKNPKLTKFIEREVNKRLQDYKPETPVQPAPLKTTDDNEDPLTEVLTRIIGNDTPEKLSAIKDFNKALSGRDEKVKQEALQELYAKESESRQAEIDAQNEVSSALDDIEDEFNVDITSKTPQATKLRSDLLSFIERISPKDKEGNITSYADFKESFKTFKEINKPTPNDRAKTLADRSISNTASVTTKQTVDSFDEFEKWKESLEN